MVTSAESSVKLAAENARRSASRLKSYSVRLLITAAVVAALFLLSAIVVGNPWLALGAFASLGSMLPWYYLAQVIADRVILAAVLAVEAGDRTLTESFATQTPGASSLPHQPPQGPTIAPNAYLALADTDPGHRSFAIRLAMTVLKSDERNDFFEQGDWHEGIEKLMWLAGFRGIELPLEMLEEARGIDPNLFVTLASGAARNHGMS